ASLSIGCPHLVLHETTNLPHVLVQHFVVAFQGEVRGSVGQHFSVIEQDDTRAEPSDGVQVVRYKNNGLILTAKFFHPLVALLLEFGIAYRQNLIHQQDIRINLHCDGKRQAHEHARRVLLDRAIDEFSQFSEVDDFLLTSGNFLSTQAQQQAVKHNV